MSNVCKTICLLKWEKCDFYTGVLPNDSIRSFYSAIKILMYDSHRIYLRILHGLARETGISQVKVRRGMARPGSRCVQRSSSFRDRDVLNSPAIIVIVTRSMLAIVLSRVIDKQV